MAEPWFNREFAEKTEKYLANKISLNEYKCWLFPNAWYLELEAEHPVHDVKNILAEYSGQGLYDFTMSEEQLKIAINKVMQLQWCRYCAIPMRPTEGCWLCPDCKYATG